MDMEYAGITVTLTAADTNYSLGTLLAGIETGFIGTGKEVTIQLDEENVAGTYVLIGDSKLSATRRGYRLNRGESRTYRGDADVIPIGRMYVRSNNASVKLSVEITKW